MSKVIAWFDENFEKIILVVLLSAIACVVMFQVIMRYIFKTGMSWTDEIARSCFIIMVLLGTAFAIKKNNIFRMTTVIEKFGAKGRFVMEIVMDVVMTAFFVYMTYHTIGTANFYGERGGSTMILFIPQIIMYWIYAVCFILCVLRFIQKLILDLKAGPSAFSKSQREKDVEKSVEEGTGATLEQMAEQSGQERTKK